MKKFQSFFRFSCNVYVISSEKGSLIGNNGLIIFEKTDSDVKAMTYSGHYVKEGDEKAIIAQTSRPNLHIVNAKDLKDNKGKSFI